jgi:hypothetical protein
MPLFHVICVNCKEFISTPYFTTQESAENIKAAMALCEPVALTCKCGFTAVYTREDLGVVGGRK